MASPAEDERGRALVMLARQAIEEALGLALPGSGGSGDPLARPPARPSATARWLEEPGACFVTLTHAGKLRGCIGSVRAHRPLGEDVRANARAAAFTDPRFPPLSAAEWPHVEVEVSLLSPPIALPSAATEEQAAAALRPGTDGVVLEYRDQGATFLPQVWEQLPNPRDFLSQLKRKAGLLPELWSPDILLLRYTVRTWSDRG